MPFRLLKFGFGRQHAEARMFRAPERLRPGYDVVIIGGGGHGLAIAYPLPREHGIRTVAVVEKSYFGGSSTARDTNIIRSNYLTPESVRFYEASRRLWMDLAADLDLNLFYSRRGHFTCPLRVKGAPRGRLTA